MTPAPHTADSQEEPTTGQSPVVLSDLRIWMKVLVGVGTGLGSVAAVTLAFVVYFKVLGEAKAQSDAGVATVAQQATATQQRQERFEREAALRFERVEAQGNRIETKMDAMLTAFRVPNPAPTPKDGGP